MMSAATFPALDRRETPRIQALSRIIALQHRPQIICKCKFPLAADAGRD
jgi:hypothetical protein